MDSCARAFALMGVLFLAGCGGGGGNRQTPPPAPQPPPPPPPTTCEDPAAENTGGPLPCRYSHQDDHLVPTRVEQAHSEGVRGDGVRVGLLDTTRTVGPYAPLNGKVAYYSDHTSAQSQPGDPSYGHGSTTGAVLVGNSQGAFPGGVAPGAELHWAAVCNHLGCLPQWQADGLAALTGRDVSIISASIGTGRPLDFALMDTWREIYQPVIDNDILFVIANGNFASEQPQPLAVLPGHAPEYLEHWIAVTGVEIDPDTGEAAELHPWASACGDAAAWCIAAPMPIRFPTPLDPNTTELGHGTSFSTPVVSGVAALVAGKYPWMSASNLQTTVLTTATDIGEPGVDASFGWGLVNAENAIRGPARFLADFHADVSAGAFEFGNAIGGEGGLVKSGPGSLLLSQANTYAGDTWIQAGQLELTGAVAGDVFNQATLLSRGGLIAGDYTATADSVTRIEVGAGLEVGGIASLAGELNLLAPADGSEPAAIEQVLGAAGVDGEFDSVTVASGFFYSAQLDYTDTSVLANLTRTSAAGVATSLGLAAPAFAGAQQADLLLDHLTVAGSQDNDTTLHAMRRLTAAPSAEHATASLASLSGEVHGTLRVLELENVLGETSALADRIAELPRNDPHHRGLSMATGRTGMLSHGGYASAQVTGSGLVLGGHAGLSDRLRGGFTISGSRMHGHLDGLAGAAQGQRHGLSAFARYDFGLFHASAILGIDRTRIDTRRLILLGDSLEGVVGDRHDHVWHGRFEAGWNASPALAPFAAVGVLQHRQGKLAEAGADGLGLVAAGDSHQVGFGEAGLRVSSPLASGGRLGVLVAGRWIVSGRNADFQAAFAGAADARFAVAGQEMPGFTARAGLQFTSGERNGWRTVADLGTAVARDGVRDAGATLRVARRF